MCTPFVAIHAYHIFRPKRPTTTLMHADEAYLAALIVFQTPLMATKESLFPSILSLPLLCFFITFYFFHRH
jgi:hypothetical protein